MGNEVIRVCGLAVLCAVSMLLLRGVKSELALLVGIGGVVVMAGFLISGIGKLISDAGGLFNGSGFEEYAVLMLRALGIAVLCRICTDICRDCGADTVAGGVEMAGKAAILSLCIPILTEIIGYADEILGFASQ